MGLPSNISSSVKELAELSDEIWYLSGDKSSDFDWYTRRASLSAVYSTTGMVDLFYYSVLIRSEANMQHRVIYDTR